MKRSTLNLVMVSSLINLALLGACGRKDGNDEKVQTTPAPKLSPMELDHHQLTPCPTVTPIAQRAQLKQNVQSAQQVQQTQDTQQTQEKE